MYQVHQKQKHLKLLNIKKRFHFNPKSQQIYSTRLIPKSKQQQKIIKYPHDQFSTVKENHDFNDSSWLTKLVNGIQQSNFNAKSSHDITHITSIANSQINIKTQTNQNNNNNQIKSFNHINKTTNRKSVPNIINCFKNTKINNKSNCQTQPTSSYIEQNKQNYQCTKTVSQDNLKTHQNNTKTKDKDPRKKSVQSNKSPTPKSANPKLSPINQTKKSSLSLLLQKQLQKNSLVNYSSIKQQQHQQPIKNINQKPLQQPIIIDLDQISLRTQDISDQLTPKNLIKNNILKDNFKFKNKNKFIRNTSGDKQNYNLNNKIKNNKSYNTHTQFNKNINHSQQNKQNKLINYLQSNNYKPNYSIQQHNKSKQPYLISTTTTTNHTQKQKNITHSYKQQNKQTHQQISIPDNFPKIQLSHLHNTHGQIQSSYNQFLDTFKQQISLKQQPSSLTASLSSQNITIVQENANQISINKPIASTSLSKVGLIKKNNIPKINKQQNNQSNNLILYRQQQSQQNKIPTFSQRPIISKIQTIKQQITSDRVLQNQTKSRGGSLKHLQNNTNRSFQQRSRQASGSIKKAKLNQRQQKKLQPIRINIQCTHQPRQSPKFHYSKPLLITNQQHLLHSSQALKKKQTYKQIYKKLNQNNQQKIHRCNLSQISLNIQQKYQFGSILSKIKYLDHTYTQNQFINQCFKIQRMQMLSNKSYKIHKNNSNNQLNSTSKIKINKKQQLSQPDNESLPKNKIMSQTKNQKFHAFRPQKTSRSTNPKKPQQHPHTLSTLQPNKSLLYLYPQTFTTSEHNQPKHPPHKHYQHPSQPIKTKQPPDIQSIIDNLNNKLSNYIQTNNLQDTYRKFKLQFVQLRRNMLY